MLTWQVLLLAIGGFIALIIFTTLFYKQFFKRFWDIVISGTLIIVLLPLFLILTLLVRINMGKPVIFVQERIGKNCKIFKLLKYRTMANQKDKNGNLLDESLRLTKFGVFLRSSSLDELPELFSIFVGKMSFVGPRPQPKYYGPYYSDVELHIYDVKGGLLPPDSLCGKPQCSWEEQMEYELFYSSHVSLLLDIKIILSTFIILIRRLKTDYGNDTRPHLNEYRSSWEISDEKKKKWLIEEK